MIPKTLRYWLYVFGVIIIAASLVFGYVNYCMRKNIADNANADKLKQESSLERVRIETVYITGKVGEMTTDELTKLLNNATVE